MYRFILILALFAIILTAPATADKYKIITHTTNTMQESQVLMKTLKKRLNETSEFIKLKEKCTFKINCRESGKYCIVVVEPIGNNRMLKKLFKIVKSISKDSFVSRYTPTIKTVIKEEKTEPVTPKKSLLKVKSSTEPLSKKTLQQKKYPKSPQRETTRWYESIEFIALVLVLIVLLFSLFFFKSREKKGANNIDTNLLHINDTSSKSLLVDIQAHIIPGLNHDYGPNSVEEAIELIKALYNIGYKKIITTPSLSNRDIPQSSELISNALLTLRRVLKENKIDITIEAAALYELDTALMTSIENKSILSFGQKYIVVEATQEMNYELLKQYILKIHNAGYKIILAHPENYTCMQNSLEKYKEIKNMGVLFELDINSLTQTVTDNVIKHNTQLLIEHGLIDLLGSNVHKLYHIDRIKSIQDSNVYKNVFKSNTILNNYLY
ncbi:MAG: CpsB/CapC family capsule biosynthesis tyrosine phosphatase [Campylobacterota bacterium]|nr:CpsB/CapC family capsule biosynthesis tyrosine phosphatase [Campylobacterota bacterium]